MKEKMVLINPCKAYGEGRCDARVPFSALVPGLRLTLPYWRAPRTKRRLKPRVSSVMCIMRIIGFVWSFKRQGRNSTSA